MTEPIHQSEEINFIVIFKAIWLGKITLIFYGLTGGILSIWIALSLPNIYQASALLAPIDENSSSQLTGLAKTFGSIGGFNIGNLEGGISKTQIALKTITSRQFAKIFIAKHNLLIPLMAGQSWDPINDSLIYDKDIYDNQTKKWTIEIPNKVLGTPPSDAMAYEKFSKILSVEFDEESSFITISLLFPSPKIAKQWVDLVIQDINDFSREKEIKETETSKKYLENQLEKTSILEVKNIFQKLIQEQIKNRLLAETRDEYILATIDPAIVPEKKVSPRRALIVLLGGILGGFLGLVVIFFRNQRRP